MRVTVIGVPYHLDEYLPDLDLAPQPDQIVTAPFPEGDVWSRLATLYSAVGQAVAAAAGRGEIPVVASGDCLTALGTMAGLQRAGSDPGIVWLDAHGDVQTPETSTSGYLAGMALRLLTDYRPELIATRLGLRPVPEERIVLAGSRDLDPPEVEYLASSHIRQCEVAGLGAAPLPDGPLYVHIDMDVISPDEAPGLRFPTPGGPFAEQVAAVLRLLLDTRRVAAVGIACSWYPGTAAAAAVGPLLEAALAGLA
jgi:arginase